MIDISVIVPIYNGEKYLLKCINSIVKQTKKNIEVILVNDGSTDSSLKIINNLKKENSNIRILNQKNQGVSVARNNGINLSKGKYLYLMDADDWLDLKALDKMFKKIEREKADIIAIDAYFVLENGLIERKNYLKKKKFTASALWWIMFRSDLLKKHQKIKFGKNIKFAEDIAFSTMLLCVSKKETYLSEPFIYYRHHDGMATKSKNNHKNDFIKSSILSTKAIVSFLKGKNLSNKRMIYYRAVEHNYFSSFLLFEKTREQKELDSFIFKKDLKLFLYIKIKEITRILRSFFRKIRKIK